MKVAAVFCLLLVLGTQLRAQTEAAPSQLVEAVFPVYPAAALFAAIEGRATVEVQVNEKGLVSSLTLSSGHRFLEAGVLDAAKRWRFSEGAAGRRFQLTFEFKIMPKGTQQSELVPRFRAPLTTEVRAVPAESPTVIDARGTVGQ